MHLCLHVCVCLGVCVCVYVRASVCVHMHLYVSVNMCVHTGLSWSLVFVALCACLYTYTSVCVCAHMSVCMHLCVCGCERPLKPQWQVKRSGERSPFQWQGAFGWGVRGDLELSLGERAPGRPWQLVQEQVRLPLLGVVLSWSLGFLRTLYEPFALLHHIILKRKNIY